MAKNESTHALLTAEEMILDTIKRSRDKFITEITYDPRSGLCSIVWTREIGVDTEGYIAEGDYGRFLFRHACDGSFRIRCATPEILSAFDENLAAIRERM
jgi:hypothetical protein